MYKVSTLSNYLIEIDRIGKELSTNSRYDLDIENEDILHNKEEVPINIITNKKDKFKIIRFGTLLGLKTENAIIYTRNTTSTYTEFDKKDDEFKEKIRYSIDDMNDPIVIFKLDATDAPYGLIIEREEYLNIKPLVLYNHGWNLLSSDYKVLKYHLDDDFIDRLGYKNIGIYTEDKKDKVGCILYINKNEVIIAIKKDIINVNILFCGMRFKETIGSVEVKNGDINEEV